MAGEEPDSRRGALIALVVVVVLVVAGIWLSGALRRSATVQDCVMAGRRNCAPVSGG
jgi:hypothetical protein